MSVELFGTSFNPWADAAIRLQLVVGFMTVVVMGLISVSYTHLRAHET